MSNVTEYKAYLGLDLGPYDSEADDLFKIPPCSSQLFHILWGWGRVFKGYMKNCFASFIKPGLKSCP